MRTHTVRSSSVESSIVDRAPQRTSARRQSMTTSASASPENNLPSTLHHNGVHLKPEFYVWKPWRCPVFGCKKGYTHQRTCKNHPGSMCVQVPKDPLPLVADGTVRSKRTVNGYAQRFLMTQQRKLLGHEAMDNDSQGGGSISSRSDDLDDPHFATLTPTSSEFSDQYYPEVSETTSAPQH